MTDPELLPRKARLLLEVLRATPRGKELSSGAAATANLVEAVLPEILAEERRATVEQIQKGLDEAFIEADLRSYLPDYDPTAPA